MRTASLKPAAAGAITDGAELLIGGGSDAVPASCPRGGFFVAPTVFKVTPGHKIWREEVFGPVLSVLTFRNEAQALQLANDSEFGLGGMRGVISVKHL
jgi:acyl-CoA reductase-like NAD-dependent aldehyde dehydrogenase